MILPFFAPVRVTAGQTGHLQGVAVDTARGAVYWSFTTRLLKTDLSGRLLGSVCGLAGHLGCIALHLADGRVWGSLELKRDVIGAAIARRFGFAQPPEDAFYAVCFDGARIDRPDMDAAEDGVMTAAFLPDVAEDFAAAPEGAPPHRFGCSGIDGITFAPAPGGGPERLYIAYGIYGDVDRADNDDQVLLELDPDETFRAARPLSCARPHRTGLRAGRKLFVRTGNTNYGIQNLEYDADTRCLFAAVYCGRKPQFPNHPLYLIDLSAPARRGTEGRWRLPLASYGADHPSGIRGLDFPLGSTGLCSLGGGLFAVADASRDAEGNDVGLLRPYRFTGVPPEGFEAL